MKSWKYYAKLALDNSIYTMDKDKSQSKKNKKKSKKFFKKYGFHYEETWNLDESLACFLVPRLAYLRDKSIAYPYKIGEEKWNEILTEMIEGFSIALTEYTPDISEEDKKKIIKARQLLVTYWDNLWD